MEYSGGEGGVLYLLQDAIAGRFHGGFAGEAGEEVLRSEVGGHDDDGVGEVDCSALAVGEAAVVEDLEQGVEHRDVGLLHLVEEDHAVGSPPDRLRQLAPFFVPHVPEPHQ